MDPGGSPSGAGAGLVRQIGFVGASSVFVGGIIGSGIFRSPHSVAREVDSGALMLLAWALGGALSLCASLSMVELAVAYPRSGGMYAFLRETLGPAFGFVFGWAHFLVFKPTSLATIASIFGEYGARSTGLAPGFAKALAFAGIAVVTAINVAGVREGVRTQVLFTVAKVAGIALLVAAAFALPASPAEREPSPSPALGGVAGVAVAVLTIFWAYDGWADAASVAGEIRRPQRVIPWAFLAGMAIVAGVYLLANAAYLAVLSPAEMAEHREVAAETADRVLGPAGGLAVGLLVVVSTFGALNGSALTGARVTLAMAEDGIFWRKAARLHARRGTPHVALLLQGALAATWLSAGRSYDEIANWAISTMWTLYALGIAGLFVLRGRVRRGAVPPPAYRTPGFPVTPLLFMLGTLVVVGASLTEETARRAAGLLVAAAGLPAYAVFAARNRRKGTARS